MYQDMYAPKVEGQREFLLGRHFDENTEGRDFFVGDLHGMYDEFMASLAAVDFDFDTDRVFSVGDLIDRGPDSIKCLELLAKSWFFAVLGNHEELMMGSHGSRVWMMNGGDWSYSQDRDDLAFLRGLIRKHMPYTMSIDTMYGTIGMVHAESEKHWGNNDKFCKELNTWARHRIKYDHDTFTYGIDRVVVGHTPLKEVVRFTNHVYIDTGACFTSDGGFLTLLDVHEIFSDKSIVVPVPELELEHPMDEHTPLNDDF